MELEIKNYMEQLVGEMVGDIIKENDCCNCERCRLDVMAIALNNLPSKYIVTKNGERYMKLALLREQLNVDVITELTKAAQVVKENKRH